MKQICLKPQDLVAAICIGLTPGAMSYVQLAQALALSTSEAHGAVQRAVLAGLVVREPGSLHANATALNELLAHGLRYMFPPVFGPTAQGVPTGAAVGALAAQFSQAGVLPWVWPQQGEGTVRGLSLCPLYPSVPLAAQRDARLHEALAWVDAVRAGAARERELALQHLAGCWA